jgi:hypothetical protein
LKTIIQQLTRTQTRFNGLLNSPLNTNALLGRKHLLSQGKSGTGD